MFKGVKKQLKEKNQKKRTKKKALKEKTVPTQPKPIKLHSLFYTKKI